MYNTILSDNTQGEGKSATYLASLFKRAKYVKKALSKSYISWTILSIYALLN